MTVEKIMTPAVISVDVDDDLSTIRELFHNHGFHHLLVTEHGRLVGVISDRDLLRSISPYLDTPAETTHDAATLNKRAHQIMTRNPVTITAEAPVLDAVERFNHKGVACLPVVNEQREPVGVVTWRDILKAVEVVSRRKLH